ncbi:MULTISPECIES: purine-cytosine permease family protein [Parachlamydia]|jgi:purine-cytosine permease-like protein|uniref:Cytosine permease n=2 Tax=Parachlamydia acanthamoebae TaxID=83552 RepID=F8KV62_PARAV|nr:hypothetical protein [Parachlamydia acanthamoebae]EFB40593.1 hypothetical protein pah_c198o006 [Parachlamydia acanthamoebae str. Hall's coccus]CCB87584.1 putative uncharacterized protein [Parachlamydia acanthamoebae UV-7]
MIEQQNWWKLSSIQIGGVVCLPMIMIGQTLNQQYGFASAICGILLGNAILLLMALVITHMACENRKTTMENAIEYFGKKGVSFFALTMSLSTLVWFSVQLKVMSLSLLDILHIHSEGPFIECIANTLLGLLITFVVFYGIRAMEIISNISMPLLLLTLGYAWYTADSDTTQTNHLPLTFAAISAIMGMAIVYVIDLPTFMRHARSSKDGMTSIFIMFILAMPILESIGVYLAAGKTGNIIEVLKRYNGPLWNLWVSLFLILAGWTTNNMNLYSGATSARSIFPNLNHSFNITILIFGVLGTLLANFDLLQHLSLILEGMGIVVTSMGTVIITRYLMMRISGQPITSRDYPWHFAAWFLGTVAGILSMNGIAITAVSTIDSAIAAHLGTFLILLSGKQHEKAYA